MFPKFKFDANKFYCEAYQLAKHCVSTYPVSLNKSLSAFSIVHDDVWGPSPITSLFGFTYFVTFVDDYSHITLLIEK